MHTLLLLTLGCNKLNDATPGTDPSETTENQSRFDVDDAPGPDLSIRTRGPADASPEAILIAARQPIFGNDEVGKAPPEGTVFELSPAAEGTLSVLDRYTLAFTPSQPLVPNTTYTATLRTIISKDASITPIKTPSAEGWSHVFTTPPFSFSSIRLVSWEEKEHATIVALSWTAPPSGLPEKVKTKLDGIPGEGTVLPGGSVYEVYVRIEDPIFGQEKPPSMILEVQIPEATITGGSARTRNNAWEQMKLDFGNPAMKVLATKVREGAKGFYVDVICDDDAVTEKYWWWDRQSWDEYNLSTHCMLTEEALKNSVHFSPDVKLTMAPGNGGFRVFGDFIPGTEYKMVMDAGAATEDGGALQRRYESTLPVPHHSPRLQFAGKGRYLPRSSWRNLAIAHTNTEKVRLKVHYIPEENLVFWLSGAEPADQRTSNLILDTELSLSAPLDIATTSYIDIGGKVPDVGNGVYELNLERVIPDNKKDKEEEKEPEDTGSTGENDAPLEAWQSQGASAVARLLRTDMHLIARMADPLPGESTAQAVDVWAIDVHDNQPIDGVEIRLVRPSGYLMGTCKTAGDGHCQIAVSKDDTDTTPPMAIIAKKGNDLSYLKFSDLRTDPEGDISGTPWHLEEPYRAAPYMDRGVYRPGDTAHFSALIRTESSEAPKDAVPIQAQLNDPQGRMIRQKVLSPNAAGLINWDLPFGEASATGRWTVNLRVAKRQIGSLSFQVEEFVPERLRVDAQTSGDFLAGADMPIGIDAAWLFGAPASDARTRVDCRVEPSSFQPPGMEKWHFGPAELDGDSDARLLSLGEVDGVLNTEGKGTVNCPTTRALSALTIPSQLVATTSVFEGESGRATVDTATAAVHPEKFYIGLQSDQEKAVVGTAINVSGRLVDWAGKDTSGAKEIKVEVFQLEEESIWTWDEENYRSSYRRFLRRAPESQSMATVSGDGRFSTTLTPSAQSSGYLVVATAGKAKTELYLPGESRWWWWSLDASVDETPRPEAPKPLPVELPESAKVGDKIPVKVMAPFAGRILYTVETDHVIQYSWKTATAGENTWEFPISAFSPNVYVTALLVKDPHLESQESFLPDRAFGVRSVRIEPTAYTLTPKITVPEEIRPYSKLTVEVDVGQTSEPAWVTVSAVDEGILSLTHFEDPDPNKILFQKRALGVSGYETIGWTLLSAGSSGKKTGGDSDGGGGRVQMVKPVSLWSGPVEVQNGKATVSFDVPGYRGELRVMAVAATRSKTGHVSAKVKVREPLVLQTTLPRFLLLGDVADVPVRITNMSGAPQEVKLSMVAEGIAGATDPVDISGGGTLKLGKDEAGTVRFKLSAKTPMGGARLRVVATAGSLSSKEELEIPLQPPRAPAHTVNRITLAKGNVDLRSELSAYIPGTDTANFWITTNPFAPAMSRMRYLIHYPYGCIEQTSSATRPLIYAGNLLASVDTNVTERSEDMVQRGIERIFTMQTPSGGFSYWPGGDTPNPWGSSYATQVLLEAKKAGFAVNEEALNDAISYLERVVDGKGNKGDGEHAYAHYVLALAGKGRAAAAASALEETPKDYQANENSYLLKAAMYLAGDRRFEKDLRTLPEQPILFKRQNNWYFYSDMREYALILSTFRDLFGLDPAGDKLADMVAGALGRRPDWGYTTQEIAWAVSGLGKSIGTPPVISADPTLSRDGVAIKATPDNKNPDITFSVNRGSLANDLSLTVPDDANGHLYLVSSVEGGLKVDDRPSGGVGLSITRRYLDAEGEPLSGPPTLGDTFYVQLSLTNISSFSSSNIALVDRVPAGWEIENPRLGRGGMPEWENPDRLWATDYMDVRDDHVSFFGNISGHTSVDVVYMVRAVTAGSFTLPAASAEAMYDPEIWARLENGTATVRGLGEK